MKKIMLLALMTVASVAVSSENVSSQETQSCGIRQLCANDRVIHGVETGTVLAVYDNGYILVRFDGHGGASELKNSRDFNFYKAVYSINGFTVGQWVFYRSYPYRIAEMYSNGHALLVATGMGHLILPAGAFSAY